MWFGAAPTIPGRRRFAVRYRPPDRNGSVMLINTNAPIRSIPDRQPETSTPTTAQANTGNSSSTGSQTSDDGRPRRGMMDANSPINRAADQVSHHQIGLTPSTADTGEDLASMMPDRRHAMTTRAVSAPTLMLAGGA